MNFGKLVKLKLSDINIFQTTVNLLLLLMDESRLIIKEHIAMHENLTLHLFIPDIDF